MNFSDLDEKTENISQEIFNLIEKLYPICRSITGEGVRQTLKIIEREIPLKKYEIATGTQVFDWKIPKEWNVKDAYIKNLAGEKIVDFKKSNLHLVNYSIPIKKRIQFNELKEHLFSIPEQPQVIPYVTSYYSENWGFCLEHEKLLQMKDEEYEIVIESKIDNGSLTYGEYYIPGKSEDEIIFSAYVCHPSMCNDNLSGTAIITALAKYLKKFELNYSLRFLFVPETIGAITWLFLNQKNVHKIKHGLVLTCIGDSGNFSYKKSRIGDSEIDNTVEEILKKTENKFDLLDFYPWGSDERQYCSPGFNLPVGTLMRSVPTKYKEYHTSSDNLEFMNKKSLQKSFEMCFSIISELEKNFDEKKESSKSKLNKKNGEYYVNLNPMCEPHLGKYGLYNKFGALTKIDTMKTAIFWILSLTDGTNSVEDIAKKSNLELDIIKKTIKILEKEKLVRFYEKV